MRVSQYYKLGLEQPFLDFLDVPIDTDVPAFIDPTALKQMNSDWAHIAQSLMQSFFERVLEFIRNKEDQRAINHIAKLNEGNEFHLGLSKGESKGHGFGPDNAVKVWKAISSSRASQSGLLQDLEDTCLVIEGIGSDMISDAICNILRGPLIEYTQEMCRYYGIPMQPNIPSGPIWDGSQWTQRFTELPMTPKGKIILVPKIIARYNLSFRSDEYYRHYLLVEMQSEEIRRGSSLVHYLKDGTPRVTKTDLMDRYGSDKAAVERQTLTFPTILQAYKNDKLKHPILPLDHEDIAELTNAKNIDWDALITELKSISPGKAQAYAYEECVERIATAIFYPSLTYPSKQTPIHNGRKRIDITYTNEARRGFFFWVQQNYSAAKIFIECKNYENDPKNPEIDQLAGRFNPSRGKVGILIHRTCLDPNELATRCKDTAQDDRGFILTLTDDDLIELINERRSSEFPEYRILRDKFDKLIM
ncbi:hypothetical protein [Pseudomonas sp. 30_B]|uniref:hypothetical protein n=1 Tax=Pseudomonas sp. 30_B TaxID=2813575 RepID=UPI001A9E1944|nr:hypothetical protein [Pseudomonas sp. 30_B]